MSSGIIIPNLHIIIVFTKKIHLKHCTCVFMLMWLLFVERHEMKVKHFYMTKRFFYHFINLVTEVYKQTILNSLPRNSFFFLSFLLFLNIIYFYFLQETKNNMKPFFFGMEMVIWNYKNFYFLLCNNKLTIY